MMIGMIFREVLLKNAVKNKMEHNVGLLILIAANQAVNHMDGDGFHIKVAKVINKLETVHYHVALNAKVKEENFADQEFQIINNAVVMQIVNLAPKLKEMLANQTPQSILTVA